MTLQDWEEDPDYKPPSKRAPSKYVGVHPYHYNYLSRKGKYEVSSRRGGVV